MPPAVIGLIVLLICVALFLTEWIPNPVVACLGCLLMVLFKVCTFEQAFSGFSNSIVLLMVGAMVVGAAMFDTGAAQLIGRRVVHWSHGNVRAFLLAGSVVTGVLAMFLANTAVIAAFFPVIESVCRTDPRMKRKDLCLPIACAAMYGGACTLIGCTPQLTANGIMREMTGMEMGMWELTGPGLCLLAIYLVWLQLFGFRRGQRIWGNRAEEEMELDEDKLASVMDQHTDKKKLIPMFFIVAAMMLSYATGFLSPALTAMCAAVLCFVFGCCDLKIVLREMNWECVIFLGGCLGLAAGFTASGAGELVAQAVSALLGDVASPWVIFAVLVLLTLAISQFITNSTAIVMVLPIALSLCGSYGFSPMSFCLGITFAASVACSTPLAASQITMTQVAGYKFFDYVRYTWPLTVISYIGILIFVPLFFPLS